MNPSLSLAPSRMKPAEKGDWPFEEIGIDRCGSSALALENVAAVVAGASNTRLVVLRIRFGNCSRVMVLRVVETSARSVVRVGASAETETVCVLAPNFSWKSIRILLSADTAIDVDDSCANPLPLSR